jgi:nucleoside-diphosphate-sugar epimerase
MRRAFVTGGSGFVGRNLIAALVERGVEVRALARSSGAEEAVRLAGAHSAVRGDLDAVAVIAEAMRDCDAVFHAAAKVDVWGDPAEFHRTTVQGTQNVLDAAKTAGVKRFVHVSTEAVLAGGSPIVDADETWPYPRKPAGLYPLTKGLAEQRVVAANCPALTTVAIRPPLIWGKGDTSVLPKIASAVRRGQWMWFGGGHYLHATTHIANVVHGLLLAAEKGRGGEVYFVTDGAPQDFRDFVTAQLRAIGIDRESRSVPYGVAAALASGGEWVWRTFGWKSMPPLPRSVLYLMGQKLTVSDAKARRELGYAPVMTVERGLAELAGQHR